MKNNNNINFENLKPLSKNQFATELQFWPGKDTYDELQSTNYEIFLTFIKEIKLEEKIKATRLKIKNMDDQNLAHIADKNLNDIVERYEKIKQEAGDNYVYYFHYLSLLNLKYFINDLKKKIGANITNMLIENYIKYSQDIIIFLNKINNINNIK